MTSAYHMPAPWACSARPVLLSSLSHRLATRGTRDALRPFDTLGDGLRRTDTAMREWVGLVAYWLADQTPELFPGPAFGRLLRSYLRRQLPVGPLEIARYLAVSSDDKVILPVVIDH